MLPFAQVLNRAVAKRSSRHVHENVGFSVYVSISLPVHGENEGSSQFFGLDWHSSGGGASQPGARKRVIIPPS